MEKLPNIKCQTGIEAGRHESETAPKTAAEFTLATLYNLRITKLTPLLAKDDGKFIQYKVLPRITYADLEADGKIPAGDEVFMAREINGKIEEYQYDEMEAIKAGSVVAIAKPSGIILRTKQDFAGIFFSKSGKLYDKDPAVGAWPVSQTKLTTTKFCYPCEVSTVSMQ